VWIIGILQALPGIIFRLLVVFFRYYWVTNLGCLIAYIVNAASENEVPVGTISKPVWYLGIVQVVSVVLGMFFIMVGKRWYIRTTPDGRLLPCVPFDSK
jgi:hypothetical protein